MPRRKKESSGHWLEPRSDESVVWSWGFLEGCAGHPPSLLLLPYLLPHPTLPAVVCTLLPLSLGPPPLFLPLRFLLPQSPLSWNYSFLSSLLLRKPSAYRHLFRALLFLFITSRCNWAGLCGASRGRPCPVPSASAPLWSTHIAVPDALSFTTACCQEAGFTVLGQPTQLWFSSNKTSHLIFTVKLWGPYGWGLAGLWLCLCVICPQCILNWMKRGQLGDVLRNRSPLYAAASPWTPFTEDLLAFS